MRLERFCDILIKVAYDIIEEQEYKELKEKISKVAEFYKKPIENIIQRSKIENLKK